VTDTQIERLALDYLRSKRGSCVPFWHTVKEVRRLTGLSKREDGKKVLEALESLRRQRLIVSKDLSLRISELAV
jgi:hypothetical protein